MKTSCQRSWGEEQKFWIKKNTCTGSVRLSRVLHSRSKRTNHDHMVAAVATAIVVVVVNDERDHA